jgi:thioredoxin 1
MPPILKDLKGKVGDNAIILKMDIDKNPEYARRFNVQAVPTLIVFKEGKIIWRNAGVTPAHEIVKHLEI